MRVYYLLFVLLFLFLLPVPGKKRWEMTGLNGLRICHSESALSIHLGILDKGDLLLGTRHYQLFFFIFLDKDHQEPLSRVSITSDSLLRD